MAFFRRSSRNDTKDQMKNSARIKFVVAAILLSVFGMAANAMGETLPVSANIDSYSNNWSGYAITPSSPVSDIQGNWAVPAVNSSVTPNGLSASWIGIDGFNSGTVEQIGTMSLGSAVAASSGLPQYFAWFEMFPGPAYLLDVPVTPGDKIQSQVQYVGSVSGSSQFFLSITDLNPVTGFVASGDLFAAGTVARSSAEWIVEAPTGDSGILPLADFGSEAFTDAFAALDDGTSGSISAFSSDQTYQINLIPLSGLGAVPSDLSGDGSAFTDYVAGVPEPSTLALLGCAIVVGSVVGSRRLRRA